jgi:ABC-2 type transport system ATP-binding protein
VNPFPPFPQREGTRAIEARGLGRDYGPTRALGALDISVPPGAIVGLVGPNGAGKTTAMLLMATLLVPSRGTVRVFGHDAGRERAAIRRRLGLVFQEASIDGLLTVAENLSFAAGLMGLGGAAARRAIADVVRRTGLESQIARPARQLSGGWRRLTDIARALIHGPDLLILDEPTIGLDPEHRDRTWALLDAERRDRGATILFSTHYLAEAESCDRVVMLAGGDTVASDTPAALISAVGDQVVEVEGPGAGGAEAALETMAAVNVSIRTDRGYRIGISGARSEPSTILASLPHVDRLAVRPATLEDVYFVRTQAQVGAMTAVVPGVGRAGAAED